VSFGDQYKNFFGFRLPSIWKVAFDNIEANITDAEKFNATRMTRGKAGADCEGWPSARRLLLLKKCIFPPFF